MVTVPYWLISEEEAASVIKGCKIGKTAGPIGGFGVIWKTDLNNNIVKENYR